MKIPKLLNPKKYLKWIQRKYYLKIYDVDRMRKIEVDKFNKIGFKLDDSLKKLDQILLAMNKSHFTMNKGMASIHWVLFTSISIVSSVKDILEIGTYDGETTSVLSGIFPDSKITTVDLPDDDPIYKKTYHRADSDIRKNLKNTRDTNLNNPNISLLLKNSFFLPEFTQEKYDLIWIDGGHLYPEVAWDICNAFHLCKTGGWILCDDVIPLRRGHRDEMVSPDSYEVLNYIEARTGYEVNYFLKREDPIWSADPRKRKYVAVMRKML
ncbi:class I SAM-dependent methyltransferase [Acidobacteriota bacterium]